MIEYVFFDVSGTLLSKPSLFVRIHEVLANNKIIIDLTELRLKHKLLSEVIKFPDRTDVNFYNNFNSELLYLLGIVPTEKLLREIFDACTYLPWERYMDTQSLSEIEVPIGIISNFNSTLKDKLDSFFGPIFSHIVVSEEEGVAKPELEIYNIAAERCNVACEKILYIGDSIKLDFEPATKIGMKSLIIDRDSFYGKSEKCIASLDEIKNHMV